MQKIIIILFLGCVLFSCKKEDLPSAPSFNPGSKEFGNAIGTKNGTLFECSVNVFKEESNVFYISFETEEGEEATREKFSCSHVPLKIGIYTNIKTTREQTNDNDITALGAMHIGDGCVIDNFYDIDTKASNYVKVTSIDLIKGNIKGEVDLRFNIRPPQIEPSYASILHFKKVAFEAKIQ